MNTEQQEARKFLEQKVKQSKEITDGLQYLSVSLYDSVAIVMDEFAKSKAKIIAAQPDVIKSVCECGAEHSNEAKYVGQCNYCLKAIV